MNELDWWEMCSLCLSCLPSTPPPPFTKSCPNHSWSTSELGKALMQFLPFQGSCFTIHTIAMHTTPTKQHTIFTKSCVDCCYMMYVRYCCLFVYIYFVYIIDMFNIQQYQWVLESWNETFICMYVCMCILYDVCYKGVSVISSLQWLFFS